MFFWSMDAMVKNNNTQNVNILIVRILRTMHEVTRRNKQNVTFNK